MRDDRLTELLREADADWSRQGDQALDLASQVRARLAARVRRRRTAVAVGAVALVAVLSILRRDAPPAGVKEVARVTSGNQRDAIPQPDRVPDSASAPVPGSVSAPANIARLRAEAEFHTRLAHDLMAINNRARERRSQQRTHKQDASREPLDVVAYRMILRADAILASMQSAEEAATIYRQVVRLFPTTGSAELAKERLMKAGFSAEDI